MQKFVLKHSEKNVCNFKRRFCSLISGKSLSDFGLGLRENHSAVQSLGSRVLGSELHCISPMLFFGFTFFTHGLSNTLVLYTVNKECVSQRVIKLVFCSTSGALLSFPSGLLLPGEEGLKPKQDLLRQNPFVFLLPLQSSG